jgi:hypothetical protein
VEPLSRWYLLAAARTRARQNIIEMDTQAIRTKTMGHQESRAHASDNFTNVLFRDATWAMSKLISVRFLRLFFRESLAAKSEAQVSVLS